MQRGPDAGRTGRSRELLRPQGNVVRSAQAPAASALDPRAALGKRAEALVADELQRRGFVLVARNVRVGRLEIDIIARTAELVVFCEVRSLSSDRLMSPAHTITREKAMRVRAAAARWLTSQRLRHGDTRFDAAAVIFDCEPPRIEYYEGAF